MSDSGLLKAINDIKKISSFRKKSIKLKKFFGRIKWLNMRSELA